MTKRSRPRCMAFVVLDQGPVQCIRPAVEGLRYCSLHVKREGTSGVYGSTRVVFGREERTK